MNDSNPLTDAFRAMLVREFYLEPHFREEFKTSWLSSLLAQWFARPASKALATTFRIPPDLVEQPIRASVGDKQMALPVRAISEWPELLTSTDDSYHSCCRNALCHAINGSREWAFEALRVAASKHDDWFRHHQIYGLIHGVDGNVERSSFELRLAERADANDDVRQRIGEAIALNETERQLPEVIQLILQVMKEVRGK